MALFLQFNANLYGIMMNRMDGVLLRIFQGHRSINQAKMELI